MLCTLCDWDPFHLTNLCNSVKRFTAVCSERYGGNEMDLNVVVSNRSRNLERDRNNGHFWDV